MKLFTIIAGVVLAVSSAAFAAEDAGEVDAVVVAVKAANPNLRSLCQTGSDGIRKAVTEKVMELASAGKIKGNPQAIGGDAGKKLGQECRG